MKPIHSKIYYLPLGVLYNYTAELFSKDIFDMIGDRLTVISTNAVDTLLEEITIRTGTQDIDWL